MTLKRLWSIALLCLVLLPGPQSVAKMVSWPTWPRHQATWNKHLLGVREQVPYAHIKKRRLTFYLFHPRHGGNTSYPVVIYVHGGALRFGTGMITAARTPHNHLLVALERKLISEHIDFISVNYRLAPMHPWPIPLHDVEHALNYVDRHARKLHIDSHSMAVIGDSAGGELSSFVGLTMHQAGSPGSVVRGVVDLFGPTDRQTFAHQWRLRHGLAPNPVYGVYTPRRTRRESAISYVHRGAPPFLIIQGSRDRIVPPRQSVLLRNKLKKYGVPVKEIVVRNAGHELVSHNGRIHPSIPCLVGDINQFLLKRLSLDRVAS